jgi:hypothetical protein
MAGPKAAIRKILCSSGKGGYSGSTAQRFSPSMGNHHIGDSGATDDLEVEPMFPAKTSILKRRNILHD